MAERPWLAELTARYGESRIGPGPVELSGSNGDYVREAWVWFPGGHNHSLAIDRFGKHTVVAANGEHRRAELTVYNGQPSDTDVRAVLVAAGFLKDGG